jgi:hypothetical protein
MIHVTPLHPCINVDNSRSESVDARSHSRSRLPTTSRPLSTHGGPTRTAQPNQGSLSSPSPPRHGTHPHAILIPPHRLAARAVPLCSQACTAILSPARALYSKTLGRPSSTQFSLDMDSQTQAQPHHSVLPQLPHFKAKGPSPRPLLLFRTFAPSFRHFLSFSMTVSALISAASSSAW